MNELPKSVAGNPLFTAVVSVVQELPQRYYGYRKKQVYTDAFERGTTQLSVSDSRLSIEQMGVWSVLTWLREYTEQGGDELFSCNAKPAVVLRTTRPEALADLLIDKIPYVLLNQSVTWSELDDDDVMDTETLECVSHEVLSFLDEYQAPSLLFYALARLI